MRIGHSVKRAAQLFAIDCEHEMPKTPVRDTYIIGSMPTNTHTHTERLTHTDTERSRTSYRAHLKICETLQLILSKNAMKPIMFIMLECIFHEP